jgi:hypothetical protein
MSTEENKAAEHRMTEEVWNQRNFDTVDELVAPDVVEHNPVLPGQAQASSTPAPWPGWTYPPHGVQPVVVVPGSPTHAARVRRILGDRVTSCPPLAPRRTWRLDCTGPCSFNTVASCSSTRPASCDTGWRPPCPPAASTAQRCRPRSTGCNAPTILPQRATKG